MSYGALFSWQFHNPKFGFFIALLLATVKAFGKNMGDFWVAHDIFHCVSEGLKSEDRSTFSRQMQQSLAHIIAKK